MMKNEIFKFEPSSQEKVHQEIDLDFVEHGFVFYRDKKGRPVTNVKQIITKHSPDGLEWGYMGSGPSDTALNVLFMANSKLKLDVDIYAHYQEFKRKFIAKIGNEKTVIDFELVKTFLESCPRAHFQQDEEAESY